MKILFIDPDEYYHHHFKSLICTNGHLLFGKTGKEARQLLDIHRPQVVVMELLLPDEPGYELLSYIKQHEIYRHVPVIIFSEIEHLEDIQKASGLGVASYFVKGRDRITDVASAALAHFHTHATFSYQ